MSEIQITDPTWQAIMADERLANVRRKLSFHEIRLIVDHARGELRDLLAWLRSSEREEMRYIADQIERGDHHAQESVLTSAELIKKFGGPNPAVKIMTPPLYRPENCPGHHASPHDSKVCGRCGIHINELRPDEGDEP